MPKKMLTHRLLMIINSFLLPSYTKNHRGGSKEEGQFGHYTPCGSRQTPSEEVISKQLTVLLSIHKKCVREWQKSRMRKGKARDFLKELKKERRRKLLIPGEGKDKGRAEKSCPGASGAMFYRGETTMKADFIY
jgi:hypothetical protein